MSPLLLQYLDWTGNTNNSNAFFTDSAVKQLYMNHIAKVVNRNVSAPLYFSVCWPSWEACQSCHAVTGLF